MKIKCFKEFIDKNSAKDHRSEQLDKDKGAKKKSHSCDKYDFIGTSNINVEKHIKDNHVNSNHLIENI